MSVTYPYSHGDNIVCTKDTVTYYYDPKYAMRKYVTDKMETIVFCGLVSHGSFGNFLLGHKLYDPRLLLFIAVFADTLPDDANSEKK